MKTSVELSLEELRWVVNKIMHPYDDLPHRQELENRLISQLADLEEKDREHREACRFYAVAQSLVRRVLTSQKTDERKAEDLARSLQDMMVFKDKQ